ncbi:hypothetical protein FD755_003359 [Muntiacus reevesi]|uniref:Uncharacterized protein n=1 Tax=Muntiacus reevesi TaxID=9886 RepID=A0A5J5N8U3_MUNRE|nr:hypothetical protein FD755_003359 [Muntiacus reevesi]
MQTTQKGIHKTDKCLNAILNFLGGDGSKPFPCYDDKSSLPNGCGSSLFGCCSQCGRCYGICGKIKKDCDEEYQYCSFKIFDLFTVSVIHLGCKAYLDSQRAAM